MFSPTRPRLALLLRLAAPLRRSFATAPRFDIEPVRHPITPDSSVLVVGASRGIGLEFVEQLLARGCGRVFATHRGEAVPAGLQDVVERHDAADYKGKIEDALHTLSMDVDVDADVDRAVAELRELLGADGRRLTHVIHSAGVYGPRGTTLLGDSSGSDSGNGSGSGDDLVQTREELVDVFRTNAAAPFAVAQRLLPLLMEGEQGSEQEGEVGAGGAGRNDGVYAWLSSKVGSIEDNASGARYAYRASKAALNMIAKVRRGGMGGRFAVVCGSVWGCDSVCERGMCGVYSPVLPRVVQCSACSACAVHTVVHTVHTAGI